MSVSLILARVLGPLMLVVAVGILLNRASYKAMVLEILASPSLRYLAGISALITGLLMLQWHNLWVADWRVILTLFAWGGLLKGVALIAAPGFTASWAGFYRSEKALAVHAVGVGAFGVLLAWMGYG